MSFRHYKDTVSLHQDADNDFLCRVPDEAEIFTAVRSVGASKAPGPDGITALFYHTYWDIVKHDVVASVQRFFESGYLLRSINHTNIVLIPKTDNPTLASHFRPISLCSVFYKFISKILASRLKIFPCKQVLSPIVSSKKIQSLPMSSCIPSDTREDTVVLWR